MGEGGCDEEVASSKTKIELKRQSEKVDTLFMTKMAEKPYHLGPHIPIWPILGSTPPPGVADNTSVGSKLFAL